MPLVGAIDQGTSSTRFLVFDTDTAAIVAKHQIEITQICPQSGWAEIDPSVILSTVEQCMENVAGKLKEFGLLISEVKGIGITNHRESTIAWSKSTGKPFHNCIVWLDTRTASLMHTFVQTTPTKSASHLANITGLPINPYFSALKIRWILDNVADARTALANDDLLVGTVDSYLLWHLSNRTIHATDVTNASRYNLMDLKSLAWSQEMCTFYGIPMGILPTIRSSAEVYANVSGGAFDGVPLCAILGDQQSSLLGQQCVTTGSAKCTYGTGVFLLYNTGETPVFSENGMLTTVAYKLGVSSSPIYALEGAGSIGGTAVKWLRDNLGVIDQAKDVETFAMTVPTTGGCVFVPSFTGLLAPHWDSNARAVICGINQGTTKAHLCRAALQAVVCQTTELVRTINTECPTAPLSSLRVDGGMTANNLMCQMQADLLNKPVRRAHLAEATAAGVAFAAAIALKIHTLGSFAAINLPFDTFSPNATTEERNVIMNDWNKAIQRAKGWTD